MEYDVLEAMSDHPSKEGNAPPVAPPGELDDDPDNPWAIPDDFPGDPPVIQIVLWLMFGAMALIGVFQFNRAEKEACQRVVAKCNADPQAWADRECVEWSTRSVSTCDTPLLLGGSKETGAASGAK